MKTASVDNQRAGFSVFFKRKRKSPRQKTNQETTAPSPGAYNLPEATARQSQPGRFPGSGLAKN